MGGVQDAIEAKLAIQLKPKEATIIAEAINGKSLFADAKRGYDKLKASIDPEWFAFYSSTDDECCGHH